MQFVTTVYGEAYIPFLRVCLSSIYEKFENPNILVSWNEISDKEMNLLYKEFPNANFKYHKDSTSYEELHQRISLKMHFLEATVKDLDDGDVCILDCDTVVYKNFADYFNDDFDLVFTWKPEEFPINTGVLLIKNSDKIRKFFTLWAEENDKIISNTEVLEDAKNTYGGGDQRALANLLDLDNQDYKDSFIKEFEFGKIKFKPVACSELNQTNSVEIVKSGSSIFHYKGGWHPILLRHEGFTPKRSIETSYEMYTFWENYYEDINKKFINNFVIESCEKHKNIIDWENFSYEHRGIPHSEMLSIVSTIKELGVDLVIESGRCRGQSTAALAEAFKDSTIKIISIEWKKDEDAHFAEVRLQDYKNLELLYGDANDVIPEVVNNNKDKKIAVLFDGPKGVEAFKIFSNVITDNPNIIVGFFHDLNELSLGKYTPARIDIFKRFDRVFLTDEAEFVDKFKYLDEKYYVQKEDTHIYSWRPYYKGWDKMGSYGPTIGIVFPTDRDNERNKIKINNSSNITEQNKPSMKSKTKQLALKFLRPANKIRKKFLTKQEKPNVKWQPVQVPMPIDEIINRFSKSHKNISFVEIGANDGISADFINKYINRDKWKGILVEPVPYVFKRLQENYKNRKDLILENSAIAEIDGKQKFYSLRQSNDKALPEFYDRIGSFVKDVVLYHRHAIPNIEDYIEEIDVNTLSFESLLKKHNVKSVDYIGIDTEGYDFEIIKMIDFEKNHPKVILFENKHLKEAVHKEACQYLESKDYLVLGEGGNTIALDKEFHKNLGEYIKPEPKEITEKNITHWSLGWTTPQREEIIQNSLMFLGANHISGDYMEFGVWRGDTLATAFHFNEKLKQNYTKLASMNFFAFDSFEGLPEPKGSDAFFPPFQKGSRTFSKENFLKSMEEKSIDFNKLTISEGWFDETLKKDGEMDKKTSENSVSLAYIDGDLYESTVPVLEFLTKKMVSGGIMIFDDWYCFGGEPTRGEQRAAYEFLKKNEDIALIPYKQLHWHGQSFIFHRMTKDKVENLRKNNLCL